MLRVLVENAIESGNETPTFQFSKVSMFNALILKESKSLCISRAVTEYAKRILPTARCVSPCSSVDGVREPQEHSRNGGQPAKQSVRHHLLHGDLLHRRVLRLLQLHAVDLRFVSRNRGKSNAAPLGSDGVEDQFEHIMERVQFAQRRYDAQLRL